MHLWGLAVLTFLSAVVLPVRWALKRGGLLPPIARWWKVAGLLVMHGGVLLVIWTTDDIRRSGQIASWPVATGYIVEVAIEEGRTYRPECVYRYAVNNVEYTGNSHLGAPGFGGKRKRYDVASSLIEQFKPGDSVDVFYDPEQPSESTLSPAVSWDVYVKLATGALVFMIGFFVAMLPKRTKVSTQQ